MDRTGPATGTLSGRAALRRALVFGVAWLAAGATADAEPIEFELSSPTSALLSCVLDIYSGSMPVRVNGGFVVDWDRAQSTIRVLECDMQVTSVGGSTAQVQVPISFLDALIVSYPNLAVSLDSPSVVVAVQPTGEWEVSAAGLGFEGTCAYNANVLQSGVLEARSVASSLILDLQSVMPSVSRVHSASIKEVNGTVELEACLEVRVPHNPSLPGLAWTLLSVCFEATASSCASDFNGDGASDLIDLLNFVSEWGQFLGQATSDSSVDVYPDGVIDLIDLLGFVQSWLQGCN